MATLAAAAQKHHREMKLLRSNQERTHAAPRLAAPNHRTWGRVDSIIDPHVATT